MADEILRFTDENGIERVMGNIPAPLRYAWTPYGGDVPECPVYPRDQWKQLVDAMPGQSGPDWPYLPPTHDQDGVGECNCSATVGGIESARMKQGLADIRLSAADLYRRINGGRDKGSMLEDGLAESMKQGVAPVSAVPYLDWQHNHPEAAPLRKQFRVVQAFICPTFDHCYSASIAGFDLISGVMWYDNFKPDSAGWLPIQGRGRPGGHAVHGYKPTYRGDKYGIWHQNSWTDEWGFHFDSVYSGIKRGGVCVFPEDFYRGGGVGGWWAIRTVVDDGGDLPELAEGSLPQLIDGGVYA